jgi:hypothetical protein
MYSGLHTDYLLFLSDILNEFSQQILEKYLNIKFHGRPSGEADLFNAGERKDRQTRGS